MLLLLNKYHFNLIDFQHCLCSLGFIYHLFSEKLSVLLYVNFATTTFSLQQINEHSKLMLHGTPSKKLTLKASCPLQRPAHTSKCIALKPKDETAYLYFHCISSQILKRKLKLTSLNLSLYRAMRGKVRDRRDNAW